MKSIKWKILILTCIVCLSPIILGLILWDKLPDTMAVHFNFYNEPDNFASKSFVIFVLPLIMAFLQAFCCITNDVNARRNDNFKKTPKWLIPVMTVILQSVILVYGLGVNIDMKKTAVLIMVIMFIMFRKYIWHR